MAGIKVYGNFKKTINFLNRVLKRDYLNKLEEYGRQGVAALSNATPVDTGTTADSWNYVIKKTRGAVTIYWTNENTSDGVPIALLIQYGHGTSNGGYVQGIDYINPALKPIFNKMANDAWHEITTS